jgi:uncharacterized membrane protein YvbJ
MNTLIPIIIVIVIIAFLFWSREKVKNSKASYEKELLNKCFGDKGSVEQLINYELKRNPKLTREDAARNASNSITRDNR